MTQLTVPNSNDTLHASVPDLRAGGIQSGGPPIKGEGAEQVMCRRTWWVWGHSERGTPPPWHSRASQDRCEGPEATLTLSDLDEAQQNDQGQCQEFGGSEGILDPGGSLHAVTVHGREQHCGDRAE